MTRVVFGSLYNRFFRDIWLKIYRLPGFNILFQFVLTKFSKSQLFSCLQKVETIAKGPLARPGGSCSPRSGPGACFPRKFLNSTVAEMWFPAFCSCRQKDNYCRQFNSDLIPISTTQIIWFRHVLATLRQFSCSFMEHSSFFCNALWGRQSCVHI